MQSAQQRFEAMVHAFASDLYRYAYLMCRNPTLAEDLVQETFTRAWRHLGSLREESKAKSWLVTTLRREYARTFERYQPRFEDLDCEQIANGAGDDMERDVEVGMLRRALAELPDKYREALALQVIWGYSGVEIAELTGLPLATVNTRLFRARHHLRRRLERPSTIAAGRSQVP